MARTNEANEAEIEEAAHNAKLVSGWSASLKMGSERATGSSPKTTAAELALVTAIQAWVDSEEASFADRDVVVDETVKIRLVYGDPGSQATRLRVTKLWERVDMEPADRKRRLAVVNYHVRTAEAIRDGKPTPADAQRTKRAEQKTNGPPDKPKNGELKTGASPFKDLAGMGKSHPIDVLRTATGLLADVAAYPTSPGPVNLTVLADLAKQVREVEGMLTTLKANIAARATAIKAEQKAIEQATETAARAAGDRAA